MKSAYLLFVVILYSLCGNAQVANQTLRQTECNYPYLEYLPAGYDDNPDKTYPAICFFHGAGERGNGGNDITRVAKYGPALHIRNGHKMNWTVEGKTDTFIVLTPQLNSGDWWSSRVNGFVECAITRYRIDPCRLYLAGLSLGTIGTWGYLTTDWVDNKAAAMVGVAGYGDSREVPACLVSSREIPIWNIIGQNDGFLGQSRATVNAVNNCQNPVPEEEVIFTVYQGLGHNSWDCAYGLTPCNRDVVEGTDLNTTPYEWLLKQTSCEIEEEEPQLIDFEKKTFSYRDLKISGMKAGDPLDLNLSSSELPATIEMVDNNGNVIFTQTISTSNTNLPNSLTNGSYIIQIYNTGELIKTRRVLID